MTYTLRAWIDGHLVEQLDYPKADRPMTRFRNIVAFWPVAIEGKQWNVAVTAEPEAWAERAYTIAQYQHAG